MFAIVRLEQEQTPLKEQH